VPDLTKDLQGAVGVVAVIPILIGGGCREGFLNLSDTGFEVLREICEYLALALVGRQVAYQLAFANLLLELIQVP
jgi:hypothetical protein